MITINWLKEFKDSTIYALLWGGAYITWAYVFNNFIDPRYVIKSMIQIVAIYMAVRYVCLHALHYFGMEEK
jgi:hypothetical protein